jgi:YVTN family beta-propeller protein
VGKAPQGIAVNPATNQIYVANSGDSTVTVIDGASGSTTTIAVLNNPAVVAVNPVNEATNRIYTLSNGTMGVFDGITNTLLVSLSFDSILAAAVNPATDTLYVVNNYDSSICTILAPSVQANPLVWLFSDFVTP